jgi:hypothetical protein
MKISPCFTLRIDVLHTAVEVIRQIFKSKQFRPRREENDVEGRRLEVAFNALSAGVE